MKKILLMQFRQNKENLKEEQKNICRFLPKDTILDYWDALKNKPTTKTLRSYNALILGGSGELYLSQNNNPLVKKLLKNLNRLLKAIIKQDFPTLGICFGHQLLGLFLGSQIIRDKNQAETGTYDLYLSDEGQKDSLFDYLPKKFKVQLGHKDSIKNLPEKSILLASTKKCRIAGFRFKNSIYGIQFHPELTLKEVEKRIKLYPQYLPPDKKIVPLAPSPLSSKVIKNFIKKIAIKF